MSQDFYLSQSIRSLEKIANPPEGIRFAIDSPRDIPGVDRITLYCVGLGCYAATDLTFRSHTIAAIDTTIQNAINDVWAEFCNILSNKKVTK